MTRGSILPDEVNLAITVELAFKENSRFILPEVRNESRPNIALAPDGEGDGGLCRCPPEIGLLCPGIEGRVVLPEVFCSCT
jgi:hypothetical protein